MTFQKGHTPYNKGGTSWNKGMKGVQKHSEETKKKIGLNGFHYGMLGKKQSLEFRKLLSENSKADKNPFFGKHHSENSKNRISKSKTGKPSLIIGKKRPELSGEKNWRWIADRSLLKTYKDSEERRSPKYKDWVKGVKNRDNWKCRINNHDCSGKIFAHHILSFTYYPELRYNINNGITLCRAHHPRKRADEQRLIPFFQSMVEVK
jgi:hypothetical protein